MRKAVALLINDLHISKDNISEFNKNWDEALSVCKREDIYDIIVGGDMFTTRSSQTLPTLLAVKSALNKATEDMIVTIAEGNHDKVDPEAFEGYNHLWAKLPFVDVVDDHKVIHWDNCDFLLLVMSYFPENGSFIDRLAEATDKALGEYPQFEMSDIILYMHEGVHGALGDIDIDGELPQYPLLGFKAVLCGHYHNRVKIKGTNIEYIGSSRQHNFGEDEEKGYTILFDDGSYEFVKNEANTRYKTIELTASQAETFKLTEDERYKYKAKVRCSEKEARLFDKQKMMDLGFNKVEIVTENPNAKEAAASGISEKYDKDGIKKEYQNYCNENAIDSKLGIKYLEG